jgi:hypothetical protein
MEFIDLPTEQTTAVTDAMLMVLAIGCALYLRRIGRHAPWKTNLWAATFGLLALAAALGTAAHGFKMSAQTNSLFWQPLNLALGLTVALFVVGVVYDAWGYRAGRRLLPIMGGIGLLFYGVTWLRPGSFLVFIVYEALAMVFALAVYSWLFRQKRLPGAGWMAAGIFITMVAAAVQTIDAAAVTIIWPFDHNGLYHLIQVAGLLALAAGLRAALLALETLSS